MILASLLFSPDAMQWMSPLAVLYAGAAIVGSLLVLDGNESAVRKFVVVLRGLGALAFAGFLGWGCWEAVQLCDPWLRRAGRAREWVLTLGYPLHSVAFGCACWFATSLLATLLLEGGRLRRWLPIAVLPVLAAIVLAARWGPKPDDGFGFRQRAADIAEREQRGIFEGNTHEGLMSGHPEIFPAVRYEDAALACIVVLAVVSGLAFRRRRMRNAIDVEDGRAAAGWPLEFRALLLLIGAAAILGQIRLLAVVQAVQWASPATPSAEIVAALVRAVIPALVYIAIGVVGALVMWRRGRPRPGEAGADPRPEGAEARSPA